MKARPPLVSVVMPAFNARATIEEAIESALSQTHRPIEVVVVDDGSLDGTSDLVRQRFGEAVRLITAPHRGKAAARNLGLQVAEGEYVQFLDADDLLTPRKIELQVKFLEEHPEFAVAYGDVERFSAGDPLERLPFLPRVKLIGEVLSHMVESGFVLTLATLVRREWCVRVSGFDEELHGTGDWDLWTKVAGEGGLFAHFPAQVVGAYRVGDGHVSGTGDRHPDIGVGTVRVDGPLARWRFRFGRELAEAGKRLRDVRHVARGLVGDRRSWDHVVAWIVGATLLDGGRARRIIHRLRRGAPSEEDPGSRPCQRTQGEGSGDA